MYQESMFEDLKKETIGQKFLLKSEENLSSDCISMLIKYRRLSKGVEALALASYCRSKKILTTSYLWKRMVVFAYEDGTLEMQNAVANALQSWELTGLDWKKDGDGNWIKVQTGRGDENIFTRTVHLLAYMPKRYEIGKERDREGEGTAWLKALDDAITYEKKFSTHGIEAESYALDKHSKTGRDLQEQGYELDSRYSGNGYGNSYMEEEWKKYGELNPDRRDKDLEQYVKTHKYKNF